MRAILLTLHLAIVGLLYLLIAVPLMAAAVAVVGGAVYLAIVDPEGLATLAGGLTMNLLLHQLLVFFGYATSITASMAGAGSAILAVLSPWLVAFAANLVCGFLAYYAYFYRKARIVGIVITGVAFLFYFIPIVAVSGNAFGNDRSPDWTEILAMIAMAAVLLSYFVVCIFLLYRIPRRPDIEVNAKVMRKAHIGLWLLLMAAYVVGMIAAGIPISILSVTIGIIFLVSYVPFRWNAKATMRIATERKPAFAAMALAVNTLLTVICLVLLPPIGVGLLLSTALLFFLLEMVFIRKTETPAEVAPAVIPPASSTPPIS